MRLPWRRPSALDTNWQAQVGAGDIPTTAASNRTVVVAQAVTALVLLCIGIGLYSVPAALVTAGVLILADVLT
jgi:hypothetical protein